MAAVLLGAVAIVMGLAFVDRTVDRVPVSDLQVTVTGPDDVRFIDAGMVRARLLETGGGLIGTPMGQIDAVRLEEDLRALPSVAEADVYGTVDGTLHAAVRQRKPIIRVINSDGGGFYIDEQGWTIPVTSTYTARVPVAIGDLHEPFAATVRRVNESDSLMRSTCSVKLWHLARLINRDPLWNALIDQVVVTSNGELELLPRIGQQRILIGDGTALEERFDKLRAFYMKGLPQAGWRRYATVDLRFAGQVICTRRPNT